MSKCVVSFGIQYIEEIFSSKYNTYLVKCGHMIVRIMQTCMCMFVQKDLKLTHIKHVILTPIVEY